MTGSYNVVPFRTTPMRDMQSEKTKFQDLLAGVEKRTDSLHAPGGSGRRQVEKKEVEELDEYQMSICT
jgi:hypothetical protein